MQPSPSTEPQTIADACSGAFTERARRRGARLFASGNATLEGINKELALLSVQHDRESQFRIAIDVGELEARDQLRVECQCAFFTAGHPCEHVFAALLALEASGEAWRLIPHKAIERRLDVVTFRTGLPLGEDAFFDADHAFARIVSGTGVSENVRSDWKHRLETLKRSAVSMPDPASGELENLDIVLDPSLSETAGAPVLTTRALHPREGRVLPVAITRRDLDRVVDDRLKEALEPWLACPPLGQRSGADALAPDPGQLVADTRRVPAGLQRSLFRSLSGIIRFGVQGAPLTLNATGVWKLELHISQTEAGIEAQGILARSTGEHRSIGDAQLILRDGWIIIDNQVEAFSPGPSFDWVRHLRRETKIFAPNCSPEEFFSTLVELPALPSLQLHENLSDWTISTPEPTPAITISGIDPRIRRAHTEAVFIYEGQRIPRQQRTSGLVLNDNKSIILRNNSSEREWLRKLFTLGAESDPGDTIVLRGSSIPELELKLVEMGAIVERDGVRLRKAGKSHLRLSSGTDWFEVDGEIDFGDCKVNLQQVLTAVREKSYKVELPDGTLGVISASEARSFRALAGLGTRHKGKLRFSHSQAILLDALVCSHPSIIRDQTFENIVENLRGDLIISAETEPQQFQGELRSYQRIGLGWLSVLRRLSLGGCLADDMGLGKTIQVLALLSTTHLGKEISSGYSESKSFCCSLVVAPRSLVFNWRQEAARFLPNLRVVEYAGQSRTTLLEGLEKTDILLTTYGTLRRDAEVLAGIAFEYVVLDEAQTIKNHTALVSKACRSLRARHRLALSGTPIENDVSELWSIFEFLNPGMLGSRSDFVRLAQGDALNLVARGLSPLLLRRRKEEVLKELPEKTELTVYCDLSQAERRQYETLRAKFQKDIDNKASEVGQNSLRTEVLEALLRLRQMSCHPGLLNDNQKKQSSTKLEALIAHLQEVVAEGHKALVFSQFVKLLEIVCSRLKAEGIPYAYLDGQVRNRAEVVDQFQNTDECPVFLISLRAGGLGLNLTSADYVFILDPWWNPAVEAQAIDRAHRIGQTRPVFAYRYIARNTVEEKILALHSDKRALAEAIMGGDGQKSGKLSLDELRLLLQ